MKPTPLLVPCACDVPGYYVFATGADNDQAWVVFTAVWFDARCGVLQSRSLTGWCVRAGQT